MRELGDYDLFLKEKDGEMIDIRMMNMKNGKKKAMLISYRLIDDDLERVSKLMIDALKEVYEAK